MSHPRLLWLLLLLVVPWGCPTPQEAPPAEPGPDFVYYNGPEPRTLDPGLLTDSYGGFLAQNVFEGLTVWDAAGQTVQPGVAARWEISEDRRLYRFHLRQEARWSDGTPVLPEHFISAWTRVLNPDTQAAYATLLYPIQGARELHTGQTTDASTLGVRAIGQSTLEVELEAPIPYFLTLTADAVMLPINPECLKKHGWAWTAPENIVTNGPYEIEQWISGERIVLQRSERYWDAENVALGRVVALTAPPEGGLLDGYRAGQVHWTGFAGDLIEEDEWPTLEGDAGYRTHPSLVTGYLVFNTQKAPFDDVRVRQALGAALDREPIARPGGRVAATHLVPPGIPGYTPPEATPADLEQAKALLEEAGFPGGRGLPAIEIAVDDQAANVAAMEQVARQWREGLGLDVSVYVRQWRVHTAMMDAGEFQVARGAWAADYPHASNFMEIFRASSPMNPAGFRDEVFDDFVVESRLTSDPASCSRLLKSAEKRLLEQAPIVPLYHGSSRCLLDPQVQGYEDNALNIHLLKYLSL